MKALSFLINRPIAVSMTFLAFMLLGILASQRIPIALLPDIPIGKIFVRIDAEGFSAKKMENEVVRTIRHQMMQITSVEDISSRAYDGLGIVELAFPLGADIDQALFDVNEHLDRTLGVLPRSLTRPVVMAMRNSDIPLMYLNISQNEKQIWSNAELSLFIQDVVRRRLEQISGLAFVDISGTTKQEIAIVPNFTQMEKLDISKEDIVNLLNSSHHGTTALTLKQNNQEYQIVFPALVNGLLQIEDLEIKKNGKTIKLHEICDIRLQVAASNGYCISNGIHSLSLALIAQEGSRLGEVKIEVEQVLEDVVLQYPHVQFDIINDQSEFLQLAIKNLLTTLVIGTFLAICVVFLFIGNIRLPLIIGLSIPVSLLISILFFYILGLTVNVISLSGLILGIGMMIDNAIIVVDNISQKYAINNNMNLAILQGPLEVLRPLIGSVLTTTCIFVPLIFLSGISGALFHDQAIAVSTGLFVSLVVSIILVPLYYKILNPTIYNSKTIVTRLFIRFYEAAFSFVEKHQKPFLMVCLMLIGIGIFSFIYSKKERMPSVSRSNSMIYLDWNEPITAQENKKRTLELLKVVQNFTTSHHAWIGRQQFFLNHLPEQTARETRCFFTFYTQNSWEVALEHIKEWLSGHYPNAIMRMEIVPNLFDYIFHDIDADLTLHLHYTTHEQALPINSKELIDHIKLGLMPLVVDDIPTQEQLTFLLNSEKMRSLNVNTEKLMREVLLQLEGQNILTLSEGTQFLDVVVKENPSITENWTQDLFINSDSNIKVALNQLGTEMKSIHWNAIYANRKGPYLPLHIQKVNEVHWSKIQYKVTEIVGEYENWSVDASGPATIQDTAYKEIIIILLVSIILLFFILSAQFESLSQPLIILLEIPINLIGVTLMLYLFGSSINIVSMIGVVVMAGIVINDSILKVDTINRLLKAGVPIRDAVHKAGQIRLRPIVMTSLTTILALVPFLFGEGLGNEIQKPMTLAIIGGMGFGTIVSLVLLPFFYKWMFDCNTYFKRWLSKTTL